LALATKFLKDVIGKVSRLSYGDRVRLGEFGCGDSRFEAGIPDGARIRIAGALDTLTGQSSAEVRLLFTANAGFVGGALQGPDGPGTFDLTVKVEKEKVIGEITGRTMPTQPITDVTRADKSLVLSYSFNYEGNPVERVVRLTPAPEGKMNAQISFASGAYIMAGPATKKEKGEVVAAVAGHAGAMVHNEKRPGSADSPDRPEKMEVVSDGTSRTEPGS
jgi:hypothetical protein